MHEGHHEAKEQQGSNRECIKALEGHTSKLSNILDKVTTTITKLRMALNATCRESEENQRAMEGMCRETYASLERLERRLAEGHGQGLPNQPNGQEHDAFVKGIETSLRYPCMIPQEWR